MPIVALPHRSRRCCRSSFARDITVRFSSLGSGSEGNALLVEAGDGTRVLVDCGFGIREAIRRLDRLGVEPSSLSAILVTHEHSDHVGGVFRLARRYAIPVHLTRGTWLAACPTVNSTGVGAIPGIELRIVSAHRPFSVGGLGIEPFTVPHDAREPVQYVFDDGHGRLGVLTDIGHPTPHLPDALPRLTALVLETNHDAALLAASAYPPSLKRRIGGRYGHLENADSATLLERLDRSRLRTVVAAHLSRQNNRPGLARAALSAVLGSDPDEVLVADQDDGLGWTGA
jgi:phosphoribosyl 1,2-cyclic phosphodiesterase